MLIQCHESKARVQHGDGVGYQNLLIFHAQDSDEYRGCTVGAPHDHKNHYQDTDGVMVQD